MPYHIQYIPQNNCMLSDNSIYYVRSRNNKIKTPPREKTPKKTIISWYHFSSRNYHNHPASFAGSAAPLSAITGGSCQYLANGSILLLQSHVPLTLGHPLSACVGFLCESAIKVLSFSSLLSHTFLE